MNGFAPCGCVTDGTNWLNECLLHKTQRKQRNHLLATNRWAEQVDLYTVLKNADEALAAFLQAKQPTADQRQALVFAHIGVRTALKKKPLPFAPLHREYTASLDALLQAAGMLEVFLSTLVKLDQISEVMKPRAKELIESYRQAWIGTEQ